MGPQNKVVALLLAAVLICTSFAASAQQVDTSLSANPAATISTIDSIGTPLSNQMASEVRGELFPVLFVLAAIAGPVVWDIYFNQGLGSISVTAKTLEKMGFPGMVNIVRSYGYAI